MTVYRIFIAAAAILFAGAGCAKTPAQPLAAPSVEIQKMSPKDAARAIRFKQGSGFEIHQAALKVQGEFVKGDPALSQRSVTLNEFTPGLNAKLQWTLQQKVETDEYKKTLEEFRTGATGTEPKPSYGLMVTAGSLSAINFGNAHKLLFPSLWPDGESAARSASAVWTSKTVYEELSRTRVSTVYLNILDGAAALAAENDDLQKAIALLRTQSENALKKIDVDLMKAEGDVSNMKLQVNGKEATVQVIRARNWFGEMTVLDNPDNPLILKFSLNPPLTGDSAEASRGMNYLKDLFSFEITRVDI